MTQADPMLIRLGKDMATIHQVEKSVAEIKWRKDWATLLQMSKQALEDIKETTKNFPSRSQNAAMEIREKLKNSQWNNLFDENRNRIVSEYSDYIAQNRWEKQANAAKPDPETII